MRRLGEHGQSIAEYLVMVALIIGAIVLVAKAAIDVDTTGVTANTAITGLTRAKDKGGGVLANAMGKFFNRAADKTAQAANFVKTFKELGVSGDATTTEEKKRLVIHPH